MFSVIFEVFPKTERFDDYLSLAKELKPILQQIDGFIDNERFESQRRPGWILSHSTWKDEKSVVRWRTMGEHHAVQEKGRDVIMNDYHLRVGDITSDSHPPEDIEIHEQRFDETETGESVMMTLTEFTPQTGVDYGGGEVLIHNSGLYRVMENLVNYDIFSSIYTPGKYALLVAWRSKENAVSWQPSNSADTLQIRHRSVRVVRDYGMFDRRESPQYYPDADGRETKHSAMKCPVSH